jgi:hypothetical protein
MKKTKSSGDGGWHRGSDSVLAVQTLWSHNMTTASLDGSSPLTNFSDEDERAVVVGRNSFQNPYSSLSQTEKKMSREIFSMGHKHALMVMDRMTIFSRSRAV